jgi:hypothetical protein
MVSPEEPASDLIRGSVREAERLGRDARALIDWCHPHEPRPIDCTAEEVGLAALRALSPEHRARASAAVEGALWLAGVDPDLLARALSYLIADGLGECSHASLVIARREEGLSFHVSFEGSKPLEARTPAALGLGDAIARRDLARMGIALAETREPRCLTAHLPATCLRGAA